MTTAVPRSADPLRPRVRSNVDSVKNRGHWALTTRQAPLTSITPAGSRHSCCLARAHRPLSVDGDPD
jgi:hypothetical protein